MSIRFPRTLAISAPGVGRRSLERWLAGLSGSGVDAVQIRCKRRDDGEVVALARRARRLLDGEISLLVNGRADIALVVGATGVHLPGTGLSVEAVRRILGASSMVGQSTHSIDEVRSAAEATADYAVFGPVYPTPGKEAYGAPQGLAALERASEVGLPVLALGGITTIERIRECVAAGARGIAGIRLFADQGRTKDCVAALEELTESHDDD